RFFASWRAHSAETLVLLRWASHPKANRRHQVGGVPGMELKFTDYNRASEIIAATEAEGWAELSDVIGKMQLHLKASDQAGKIGTNIFDPVGTNACFSRELTVERNWRGKLAMPEKFQFLGKDIDFGKGGLLLEVQFSNYPFLLNNLLRSELLYKARDA